MRVCRRLRKLGKRGPAPGRAQLDAADEDGLDRSIEQFGRGVDSGGQGRGVSVQGGEGEGDGLPLESGVGGAGLGK